MSYKMSCKATNSLLLDMHVYMLDLGQNILQSGLYAIKMHAMVWFQVKSLEWLRFSFMFLKEVS